ncbi:MAG: acetoacetate decarboxylase family protein [Actinobacteria bacterium]|nr:acetoacetate decarboxylase family protein [Actinomycetota bacterium]
MRQTTFVRTPEQVERIKQILAAGRFTTDAIEVEFETDFGFLDQLLPPCFERPEQPTGFVNVSKWEGEMCGEFDCGMIWVKVRHGDREGFYCALMIVSGDMPVTLGREVWGECKKTGSADLHRDGNHLFGYTERLGRRLIEIEATVGDDQGPADVSMTTFEIKAQLDIAGTGLQYDPILIEFESRASFSSVREGTADLKFGSSPWDPVDTIPIVSVGSATYATGESVYEPVRQETLTDRDAYLPYVLGRSYDDLSHYRVPRRHRAGVPAP